MITALKVLIRNLLDIYYKFIKFMLHLMELIVKLLFTFERHKFCNHKGNVESNGVFEVAKIKSRDLLEPVQTVDQGVAVDNEFPRRF